MMMNTARLVNCVKDSVPGAWRTIIWLFKITAAVSFGVMLLKFFGLLPVMASMLDPIFSRLGLTGDAALAYVTGYFVNVYAAISVAATIDLDARAMTILCVMVLCSHNMFVETSVQKKTGSPFFRIAVTRTLSAFVLAFLLNAILPGRPENCSIAWQMPAVEMSDVPFMDVLAGWAASTLRLLLKMALLVFSLNILQSILSEYGVIKHISRAFKPLLAVFGLPGSCSFLWIVANTLGLAYGAAVMIAETERGMLSRKEIDLLNMHICISHSNLEDLLLFVAVGAMFWPALLSRWLMSLILVWELRLEYALREKKRCLISNR